MKKLLKGLLFAIPIVLAIALIVAYFWIGAMVKEVVLTVGPKVLGAPVKLDNVSVRPLAGKASASGLEIGNPEGFKTDYAVRLKKLRVDMDMRSLKTDTILIHGIYLDGPEVTIEGLKADNLKQLQKNAIAYTGGGDTSAASDQTPAEEKTPADPGKPKKKVVIEEIVVTGGKLRFTPGLTLGKTLDLALPELRIEGIGKKGTGATMEEALTAIFKEVDKVLFDTLADAGNPSDQDLKKIGDSADHAISEALGGAEKEIEEDLDKALGKVHGLLGGGSD